MYSIVISLTKLYAGAEYECKLHTIVNLDQGFTIRSLPATRDLREPFFDP